MPVDYSKYPPEWKQISKRIREREGDKCKWCGAPNHTNICRRKVDLADWVLWIDRLEMDYDQREKFREPIEVVLTVAHLNHDTKDNRDENLAALCQLCHLRYDAKYHAENSKATRRAKKIETAQQAGQLSLFEAQS